MILCTAVQKVYHLSGRTLTTAWCSLNAGYVKDLWLHVSFYIIINVSASFYQNKTEVILKPSFLWHVIPRPWLMEGKGLRCRVKHEAWTFMMPVNEACEWGPGNSYVGNWDRNLGGSTARDMGVRRSEEQHQRKQHKEVAKEGEGERGSVKTGTKRREGRGGEWLCLGVFQPGNSVCYCAHGECMCCNSMQQTEHNNRNNDF